MQFDWWTFAFQVVNVLVLLWLLNHFLFRPISGIIAERKAETEKVLQAATTARQAAEAAEKAARAEQERITAERLSLLEAARADAEKQREALLSKAKEDVAGILEKAKAEAVHVDAEARRQSQRHAVDLSVSIAGRLLANLPDDSRISGYPERLADALSALDEEQKAAIAAEAENLHIVAPRALSEAERQSIHKAIGAVIALDGDLAVDVDPSLIAGVELRSPHRVVHNSLGSDLARIAEAMSADEKS